MSENKKNEKRFVKDFLKLSRKKNRNREDYNKLFLKYPNYRLPCYIDSLFKELFKIRSYTAKVLSYFIDLDYEYIKDNMIESDTEVKIVNVMQRKSIADKVIIIDNYTILLECNMRKSKELTNKNINTYNGVSYTMIDKGDKIGNKKFIMISFDNYDQYGLGRMIYSSYIKEDTNGKKESKNYKIYHVNLDKIRNILYNTDDITKLNEKTRILGYIVNINKELFRKLGEDENMYEASQIIREANDVLESKTLELGDIFDKSYNAYSISIYEDGEKNGIAKGRASGLIEGRASGLIEGHAEGLIEGHAEGLIEGRNSGLIEGENRANTNTAIEMLKRKIDNKTISECTKLSIKKIRQLEKQLVTK